MIEILVARSSAAAALLGGCLTVATAVMITTSVLLRWLADGQVTGDFELAQMLTAVAVFAFLPICQYRNANIVVDFFTARAPERVRLMCDTASALLYAVFAALIAQGMARATYEAWSTHTSTMMLQVPVWIAMIVATLCAALLVLVSLFVFWRTATRLFIQA